MTELVLGFIPLIDCAPLVAARERGFAEAEGLSLTLVRESSWANIRDRLVVGHFDAAHMLGPMAVASSLGIGHVRVPLVAPFALGLGGNAITLSNPLHDALASRAGTALHGNPGDAATARQAGRALKAIVEDRRRTGAEPLTFGMVYPFSCHNYELRYWLAASGIDPDRDVRLVVIPPPLLVDSMRAGQVDGFCVGEPWNSVAVEAGVGRILLSTNAVWSLGPEKVLGCRASWAERHAGELGRLLRALYRASAWCADPASRGELLALLARDEWVGAPAAIVERALAGAPVCGRGEPPREVADFYVPLEHHATYPWPSHALWFYSQMLRWGQTTWSAADAVAARETFRPDLYEEALSPIGVAMPVGAEHAHADALPLERAEAFFDSRVFDSRDVEAYASSFGSSPSTRSS